MNDTDNKFLIYKICTASEWENALRSGAYAGNTDDKRDGFIHLSSVQQLRGTADKHFAGQSDLVLIAVNPASLGTNLKWEPSRGGKLFPHCYGDIPASCCIVMYPLPLDADGRHIFPDEVKNAAAFSNENTQSRAPHSPGSNNGAPE